MTKQDKQLLLIDLCAKFPYRVKVNIKKKKGSYIATVCEITRNYICIEGGGEMCFSHGAYKPYLRPMSSMTEEEKREYFDVTQVSNHCAAIDWLNSHHFDYRGLITLGWAIEAPEGMYK